MVCSGVFPLEDEALTVVWIIGEAVKVLIVYIAIKPMVESAEYIVVAVRLRRREASQDLLAIYMLIGRTLQNRQTAARVLSNTFNENDGIRHVWFTTT